MAIERQTIRYYCDVMQGFDPATVNWCGVGPHSSVPPECSQGYKRIWMEIEMPADNELWRERFDGFHISGLNRNVGQRAIQIDNVETGSAVMEPEVRPARRRMRDSDGEARAERDN